MESSGEPTSGNRPEGLRMMPMRSLCILTTSYPSWNEGENEFVRGKFVHDMAKSMVKAGIEVHVVTHHGKRTKQIESRDGVTIHRFHYFFPGYETLAAGSGIPENIKLLKNMIQVPFYFSSLLVHALRAIRKNNLEVINAHWAFPTGYIGLVLKKLTRKKLVTTLYGAELFPFIAGNMKLLKPFVKQALNGADLLVAISGETANAAEKISNKNRAHVIPDGIDIDYYKPGDKGENILGKYQCRNKRLIFFTGRMVERKGHRYLLEAMRSVRDAFPDVKLLLGGHGPLYAELNGLRKEWKLQDVVEMPGFLPEEEIVPLLQSADLYVLPSCMDANGDTEGSATAALEAMACGTPALVSKIGGNRGAIEEGKGAYYFEAANSQDLAKKIIMLLADGKILEQNRTDAATFIQERYSWDKTIQNYIGLIDAKRGTLDG